MAGVKHFDHVGVTVDDLDGAIAFFVSLGMEVEGRMSMEGEFLDTVCGLSGARTTIAMLRAPDGGAGIELSSFEEPPSTPGSSAAMANELGLRSVALEVEGIEELLDRLKADGYDLIGGLGSWENAWKMAYVRGPEGITVALAERIGG